MHSLGAHEGVNMHHAMMLVLPPSHGEPVSPKLSNGLRLPLQ